MLWEFIQTLGAPADCKLLKKQQLAQVINFEIVLVFGAYAARFDAEPQG